VPASDSEKPSASDLFLSLSWIRRVAIGGTAIVSLAGLTVEALKSFYRWKGRSGVVPLLSLSYEQNVPTYWTAMLLLAAAAASALLAAHDRRASGRDALAWWGLCAGFFYISVDEVLELHEQWGSALRLGGALHFGWVIPAGIIVLLVGILYTRFLRRSPPRLRNRLLLAGAVYVLGAVVMELPLGYWTEKEGQKNLGYALIDWVEETLEMTGIVLYLFTAHGELAARRVGLRFGRETP
jgi:hypothetical protein